MVLLEYERFQIGEYQIAEVPEPRVHDGFVQDFVPDEAELRVEGIEQDDEDADDKGVHRQGEYQAEDLVQPAEHG